MSVININMTNTVNNNYCKGRKKKMANFTRIPFTAEAESAAVNADWSAEQVQEFYPEALGTGYVYSRNKKGFFELVAYFGTGVDAEGDPCYLTKYLNETCKYDVVHFWNPKQHNVFGVVLFEANVIATKEAEDLKAEEEFVFDDSEVDAARSEETVFADIKKVKAEIKALKAALATRQEKLNDLLKELEI